MNWDQVASLDRGKTTILDVRLPEELALGMIDGGVHIPCNRCAARLMKSPKTDPYWSTVQTGQRSYFASRILSQLGFDVYNLNGGYKTYSHAVGRQSNFDVYEHVSISSKEELKKFRQKKQLPLRNSSSTPADCSAPDRF